MTYFSPETFRFFHELTDNNNRPWFHANRTRYENFVREPFLRLIGDLQPVLAGISPHYRADPRPRGGSLYRYYRDTRYSSDKSTYKTWASARLTHELRPTMETPAFYLHLANGNCHVSAGFWRPSSKTLRIFRDFVVDNPATWTGITRDPAFAQRYNFIGDSLKRAPLGFDINHPLIEDLRRKDWVASRPFDEDLACSGDLLPFLSESLHELAPMVDYLCAALDIPF